MLAAIEGAIRAIDSPMASHRERLPLRSRPPPSTRVAVSVEGPVIAPSFRVAAARAARSCYGTDEGRGNRYGAAVLCPSWQPPDGRFTLHRTLLASHVHATHLQGGE